MVGEIVEYVGIGKIAALAVALIVTAIEVIIAMAATTWKSTAAMLRASAMLAFCLAPVWFPAASSFLACTEIQQMRGELAYKCAEKMEFYIWWCTYNCDSYVNPMLFYCMKIGTVRHVQTHFHHLHDFRYVWAEKRACKYSSAVFTE